MPGRLRLFKCLLARPGQSFYVITVSFGLVYLKLWLGNWGLWVIMIPAFVAFTWALKHLDTIDDPHAVDEKAPATSLLKAA